MLTPGSRRRMGECRGRDTPPGLPFQRQRAPAVPLLGSPSKKPRPGRLGAAAANGPGQGNYGNSIVPASESLPTTLPVSCQADPRPPPWTPDPPPEAASRNPAAGGPVWRGFFAAGAPLPSVSAPGRPQLISAPAGEPVSFSGPWMKGSRRDRHARRIRSCQDTGTIASGRKGDKLEPRFKENNSALRDPLRAASA